MNKTYVELANYALVACGFHMAMTYRTPLTISLGMLMILVGIIDANITKENE